MKKLTLSVVIPTYNGAKRLPECLKSILNQSIDRSCYEIIIIDDKSEDQTLAVVEEFGVNKVLTSGNRDIEISKKIGIDAAMGEYILFMDDDNELVDVNWLKNSLNAIRELANVGGVSTKRFLFKENFSIADKYTSLFGMNDPVVYYLGYQDRLSYFSEEYRNAIYTTKINEVGEIVKFRKGFIPTFGSNVFLTKTDQVREFLKDSPAFYHLDYSKYIISKKHLDIFITNSSIIHKHAKNLYVFVKKCHRNGKLYLRDQTSNNSRDYNYELSALTLVVVFLKIFTVVIPIIESIRGFCKIRDIAWFVHPLISLIVVCDYILQFIVNPKSWKKILLK